MDDIIYKLQKRAEIRRQISTRKSVQEGKPDRIADLLEEAANEIGTLRNTNFLDLLNYLKNLIEKFHNKDGSKNFHFDGFRLEFNNKEWQVDIIYYDNSFSYDAYTVKLKDILEWNDKINNERKI